MLQASVVLGHPLPVLRILVLDCGCVHGVAGSEVLHYGELALMHERSILPGKLQIVSSS